MAGWDAARLAALCADARLDDCAVLVREGYGATPSQLKTALPLHCRELRAHGMAARFAIADWTPAQLADNPEPLAMCADNGIREVRVGHVYSGGAYGAVGDVRAELEGARRNFAGLARHCERYQIRAIYQLHHRTLLASASAVWPLLRELSPQWIGVMADAGQQLEGYEDWRKVARLLGAHLAAFGVKDVAFRQDETRLDAPDKGWSWQMVPIDQGMTDWTNVRDALRAINFAGPLVFLPLYHGDDMARLGEVLKREVAYLRECFAAAVSAP